MVIYSNINFSLEQNFLTYVIATCPSLVANRSFYVIANDFFHIYFDLIFPFNNSFGLSITQRLTYEQLQVSKERRRITYSLESNLQFNKESFFSIHI